MKQRSPIVKEILSWVLMIVVTVAVTLLFIRFVAQFADVDGTSMSPSLQNGDRILVEKVSYYFREPQAGEVIAFDHPTDPSERLVKRVIGEEGDHVVIKDGEVYVNDIMLVEKYIDTGIETQGEVDLVVPEGHVFVLGDNRHPYGSRDSRAFGTVPTDTILGRGIFIVWPFGSFGTIQK